MRRGEWGGLNAPALIMVVMREVERIYYDDKGHGIGRLMGEGRRAREGGNKENEMIRGSLVSVTTLVLLKRVLVLL